MDITKDYCGYPGCVTYREIDPEKKTFISSLPYFCGAHENSYLQCGHSGCSQIMVYASTDAMPDRWFCPEHHPENQSVLESQTMKVPCAFPDCPGFKTINPTEAMHDEPIRWLCEVHKSWIGVECHDDCCHAIAFFPKAETPDFWWCLEHTDGTTRQPLKPDDLQLGEFIGLCNECNASVFAAHERFDQGPLNTYHSRCLFKKLSRQMTEEPKAREAAIQTADQNKYNEQVDKAHKELILLMAFNNCTEENVRDILIRISSNCYAMGYQEGLEHKSKRPGRGN